MRTFKLDFGAVAGLAFVAGLAGCATPQILDQEGGAVQLRHVHSQTTVRQTYSGSTALLGRAFQRLARWARDNGIHGTLYGAYFPSAIPSPIAANLSPEIGIIVEGSIEPKLLRDTPYSLGEIPGGSYIVARARGNYWKLPRLYEKLQDKARLHSLVPQLPVYEIYVTAGTDKPQSDQISEIRLPVLPSDR